MKNTVFECKHYRDYLGVRLSTTGENRGLRRKLAEKLYVQPAFVSRVIAGDVDFSMEHVPTINEFLSHSEEEGHFFTLLVSQARAGTPALEKYYGGQIKGVLERRNEYMERVKAAELVTTSDQAVYYSQWYYLAIHVLVGIHQFQTREAISERLGLPLSLVSRTLDELAGMGLVDKKGGRYVMGKKRIHLAKNSPWISNFHTHFRHRAIGQLAAPAQEDLHFSMAMSISTKLFSEYRKRFLELVAEFESKMLESKDEELFALNIDLFRY